MTQRTALATTLLWLASIASAVVVSDVVVAQSPATTPVTFYKDVMPLLQKNCETCHRPGQIAPMAFQTYESTRPWARAIQDSGLVEEDASVVWRREFRPHSQRSLTETCRDRHAGEVG